MMRLAIAPLHSNRPPILTIKPSSSIHSVQTDPSSPCRCVNPDGSRLHQHLQHIPIRIYTDQNILQLEQANCLEVMWINQAAGSGTPVGRVLSDHPNPPALLRVWLEVPVHDAARQAASQLLRLELSGVLTTNLRGRRTQAWPMVCLGSTDRDDVCEKVPAYRKGRLAKPAPEAPKTHVFVNVYHRSHARPAAQRHLPAVSPVYATNAAS